MRLKNICFMAMATILCTSVLTGCGTSSAKEDSDNELYIITEDKSSISLSNSKPGMFGVTEDGEIFMEITNLGGKNNVSNFNETIIRSWCSFRTSNKKMEP